MARIRTLTLGLALFVSLALVSACAIVEAPSGGPVDSTPPRLVSVEPDSGSVGLAGRKVLRFKFSEKMDRTGAMSWLRLFPEQEYKKTTWHGATEAEVVLMEPLPADTLIVVEILPGMTDSHRVKNNQSRRYPLVTGDSLFGGRINGRLVMGDTALVNGVVELFAMPPDSLEYFQQKPLRRAVTDSTGSFHFPWLPIPGGPWLMRAFQDKDGNLRVAEKDAQRLLPDTLSITVESPTASADTTTVYSWNEPGVLRTKPFAPTPWRGVVGAWALAVTDADTGWAATPVTRGRQSIGWLDPLGGGQIDEVAPHLNRVIVFVDMDGDSTFSAVPDSVLGLPVSVDVDTAAWFLEPWGLVEDIYLEPGMEATFVVPSLGDSLISWAAPPVLLPDTLSTAAADSTDALPDAAIPEPAEDLE